MTSVWIDKAKEFIIKNIENHRLNDTIRQKMSDYYQQLNISNAYDVYQKVQKLYDDATKPNINGLHSGFLFISIILLASVFITCFGHFNQNVPSRHYNKESYIQIRNDGLKMICICSLILILILLL
ncbi:MAG TPA: hypothetical protein VLG50_07520 [Candidatus Saccharimonadales bacterium]|nr:hypothetical protein [Candidatus Saccharimonadales bacterium]